MQRRKVQQGDKQDDEVDRRRARRLALLPRARARAEDVTLQLKWVTQAQFAGYYVAKDKGFYEEEGLTSPSSRAAPTSRRRRCSPAAAPT